MTSDASLLTREVDTLNFIYSETEEIKSCTSEESFIESFYQQDKKEKREKRYNNNKKHKSKKVILKKINAQLTKEKLEAEIATKHLLLCATSPNKHLSEQHTNEIIDYLKTNENSSDLKKSIGCLHNPKCPKKPHYGIYGCLLKIIMEYVYSMDNVSRAKYFETYLAKKQNRKMTPVEYLYDNAVDKGGHRYLKCYNQKWQRPPRRTKKEKKGEKKVKVQKIEDSPDASIHYSGSDFENSDYFVAYGCVDRILNKNYDITLPEYNFEHKPRVSEYETDMEYLDAFHELSFASVSETNKQEEAIIKDWEFVGDL